MSKPALIAGGFLINLGVVFVAWQDKPVKGRANWDSAASADDLLKRRIVLLYDEVSDETATWVIAKMLFLQHQDGASPIHLCVESVGGNVVAGLAIIETMKEIRPPVDTVCRRQAHGIAAVIVASGRKGHRQAGQHARLSITPLVWGVRPEDEAEKLRLFQDLTSMVAERTGQPLETVQVDFERGREFDAPAAGDYGLIDSVTDCGEAPNTQWE